MNKKSIIMGLLGLAAYIFNEYKQSSEIKDAVKEELDARLEAKEDK